MPVGKANSPIINNGPSLLERLRRLSEDLSFQGDPVQAEKDAAEILKGEKQAQLYAAQAAKAQEEAGLSALTRKGREGAQDAFTDPVDNKLANALLAEGKYNQLGSTLLAGKGARAKDPSELTNYIMGDGKSYASTPTGAEYKENEAGRRLAMKEGAAMQRLRLKEQQAMQRAVLKGQQAAALQKMKGTADKTEKVTSAEGTPQEELARRQTLAASFQDLADALAAPGVQDALEAPKLTEMKAKGAILADNLLSTDLRGSTLADEGIANSAVVDQLASKMAYDLAQEADQGRLSDLDFKTFLRMTGIEMPKKNGLYSNSEPTWGSALSAPALYRTVKAYEQYATNPEGASLAEIMDALPPKDVEASFRTRQNERLKSQKLDQPGGASGQTRTTASGKTYTILED